MVCEISHPKKDPCEIAHRLRNHFAAPCPPLRKFSQLRNTHLAHECHFADPPTSFRSCEILHALKSQISQPSPHFAVAKPPLGTRVPFRSSVPSFRSCEMGCEMVAKMPPSAKLSPYCENKKGPLASFLNVINSLFSILTDHLNFKEVPRGAKPKHPPIYLSPPPEQAAPTSGHLLRQLWLELEELSPHPH